MITAWQSFLAQCECGTPLPPPPRPCPIVKRPIDNPPLHHALPPLAPLIVALLRDHYDMSSIEIAAILTDYTTKAIDRKLHSMSHDVLVRIGELRHYRYRLPHH